LRSRWRKVAVAFAKNAVLPMRYGTYSPASAKRMLISMLKDCAAAARSQRARAGRGRLTAASDCGPVCGERARTRRGRPAGSRPTQRRPLTRLAKFAKSVSCI
jgi:hypothetical protein